MFEPYEKLINQTGPEFYTEFMQPLKKNAKNREEGEKRRKKRWKNRDIKKQQHAQHSTPNYLTSKCTCTFRTLSLVHAPS